MFRDLRRKRQALSPQACADVLARGTSGVLAVAGDGGYPYAVPTAKQREAMELAHVDYARYSIYEITRSFVIKMLKPFEQ